MPKNSTLTEMHKEAGTLQELAQFPITWAQRLKIVGLLVAIGFYKLCILPWKKREQQKLFTNLDQLKNLTIDLPNLSATQQDNKYFLSAQERKFFTKNGYLPPFRVISSEEANALKELAVREYKNDFSGVSYLGKKIREIEKKYNRWTIEYAGLYQALRLKPFRELLRKPQIAERLASLLGDEIICWRTQFFDKLPGAEGTAWHQNATFREAGKYAKLQPTQKTSPALIQLNAWVALSDTTRESGCLRILPGSFTDARINYLYEFIPENELFFFSLLPFSPSYLYRLGKIALYGRLFYKSAVILFSAEKLLGDNFFDQFEVKDLEMKAGECLIFSSLNMHASYPNTSSHDERFSFVGRCTANHVKVAPYGKDSYPSLEGPIEYTLPRVSSFQVYGKDTYGLNKILDD
ncbi:phytanoyl-CoA dioxygenase family protein [Microbulbifer variabilis]|uniref:phytanoyl-CoA dioxygenase family protein n=1 Tax=Microbulbifer variabilis TaxID=266805 RepID=UPI001CFED039|nr:phytanoyl-CoA dioxygenase family protein [Microbulbifer variabilis]